MSGSEDKEIKLWTEENGKEIRTFRGHTDSIKSITISKWNIFIVSGCGIYETDIKI